MIAAYDLMYNIDILKTCNYRWHNDGRIYIVRVLLTCFKLKLLKIFYSKKETNDNFER